MKSENSQSRIEPHKEDEVLFLSAGQSNGKVHISVLPAPSQRKLLLHIEQTILYSSRPDRVGKKTHYKVFSQKSRSGHRDKQFAEQLVLEIASRKDLL